MRRDEEAATIGVMTGVIVAMAIVLIGIAIWFFAYRPTEPSVTTIEVEDRTPDTQVIPQIQREVVPVPVPGPTRTIERDRTIERERTIVQPPDRDVERPAAPEPEDQPETAPDVIDDTDTEG